MLNATEIAHIFRTKLKKKYFTRIKNHSDFFAIFRLSMDLLFEKFPEPIYKNGALFCFSPNHLHENECHYSLHYGLLVMGTEYCQLLSSQPRHIVFLDIKPAMY